MTIEERLYKVTKELPAPLLAELIVGYKRFVRVNAPSTGCSGIILV